MDSTKKIMFCKGTVRDFAIAHGRVVMGVKHCQTKQGRAIRVRTVAPGENVPSDRFVYPNELEEYYGAVVKIG